MMSHPNGKCSACGADYETPGACESTFHLGAWREEMNKNFVKLGLCPFYKDNGAHTESPTCALLAWHKGDHQPEPDKEEVPPKPIPMLLWCPLCHARHVDKGAFETKPHRDHSCQSCGLTWRPATVPTVGVAFLPGYKDAV